MRIISNVDLIDIPGTDVGVTLHDGKFIMLTHVWDGTGTKLNCIAVAVSDDGVKFPQPRIVLRSNAQLIGCTRGAETPSAPLPPFPGFPYWSTVCMTYDMVPGRGIEHWSVGTSAYAKDPTGFWSWGDIVLAPTYRRQQPVDKAGDIEGGLSEFSVMHVGGGVLAALLSTNSYRPKPCIYAAASAPPYSMRSWAMWPDPVIEGEGSLWAAQASLFNHKNLPHCVYAEGPPERIRVARGDQTMQNWKVGEILLEPDGVTERCVGPCMVPLSETEGRLYWSAVKEHDKVWQTHTALVDLSE